MPLTFIEIERRKSWRIAVFFLLLMCVYFLAACFLVLSVPFARFLFHDGTSFRTGNIIVAVVLALFTTSVHFFVSAFRTVEYVRTNLNAGPPDRDDEIHQRLINIMAEIHIATGNRTKMQCMVIPSLSMNALSAVDLRGNAVIAITEGLLSRLSRDQVEAVIAHEAHHILSGDCVETTVAASLFGLPSSIMQKAQAFSEGRVFLSPAYLVSIILLKLSYLLNLFISREREYRADAGAVRMTRNPMALAEVLYLLSRNWRGTGHIGNGLEMLCIVNPEASELDESEGWLADLLSTHPPIRKRIDILLGMAHSRIGELAKRTSPRASLNKPEEAVYYALDSGYAWQGPFSITELSSLPWFSTLTWISRGGNGMEKATAIPQLNDIFRMRLEQERNAVSPYPCPVCRHYLVENSFEGTTVRQCRYCGGTLVASGRIPRIIARAEGPYPERIRSLSRATLRENLGRRLAGRKRVNTVPRSLCPKCGHEMTRTFYSLAYLLEIDRCSICELTWFDRDELEMLQCMIGNKMAAEGL